jgi:hypothetical protein
MRPETARESARTQLVRRISKGFDRRVKIELWLKRPNKTVVKIGVPMLVWMAVGKLCRAIVDRGCGHT